jgi:hypothetical protein
LNAPGAFDGLWLFMSAEIPFLKMEAGLGRNISSRSKPKRLFSQSWFVLLLLVDSETGG